MHAPADKNVLQAFQLSELHFIAAFPVVSDKRTK
jgi:hypothetical protein